MALYKIENGLAVMWKGEPLDGIMHPKNIEQLWPESDLNAVGLYFLVPAGATPEGKEIATQTIEVVNGVPTMVRTYQDIQMENRRPSMVCSKLQMKAILLQYGLYNKVQALVDSADIITQLAWTEAAQFERSSQIINGLIQYLTWDNGDPVTAEEVDTLFIEAAKLNF